MLYDITKMENKEKNLSIHHFNQGIHQGLGKLGGSIVQVLFDHVDIGFQVAPQERRP